jgi:cytochrome c peroxidase
LGIKFVDKGLGAFVGDSSQNGKLKVPTLRNIAVTGPYMHNGYFNTLRGVVDFYNTRDVKNVCQSAWVTEDQALKDRCWPAAEVAANVNHDELGDLGLTDQEVDDIVAFLRTLTDGYGPSAPTLK